MPEIAPDEQTALTKALGEALHPLAVSMRSRATGLPEERMWDADPVEVALSVLTAWKAVDLEVKRLTAIAAGTAGAYGANYEQLGAAWGITRQGARKKWPGAVTRPAPDPGRENVALDLFGGTAGLARVPSTGHWSWTGEGADGVRGASAPDAPCATREEAAAHAGAFLKEHSADRAGT
ncbi:hypothetical protein [Streptomyces sp. NPDC057682]|uniref:hypothetical protein n=1 Tax=Streptomyces sp. NPDC057682 TaxID=3346210 RepID=UPI003681BA9B